MVDLYDIGLVLAGLIILGAAALPRLLSDRPVSFPILYVGFGMAVFSLPLGLPAPDPIEHAEVTERLAELGVIIALMGAGLKLDRPPSLRGWSSTWRLLAVSMPLTIASAALSGRWILGLAPAAAMLLGAVIAPTDPVLASDIQVDEPGTADTDETDKERLEPEVRFALTSEAGLNDGLAFPFTYLAITIAAAGVAPGNWIGEWVLVDVIYKIGIGMLAGVVVGRLLAWVLFSFPAGTNLAKVMEGSMALGATLLVYGLTELANGYGFIAVFVAALAIRDYERTHEFHSALHDFVDSTERLIMAVLLVLLGGAVTTGLFAPLTWEAAAIGLALVLVVRPLAGLVGLLGFDLPLRERAAISFFGIRGIGSFYYLSYGLNQADIADPDVLWALVGFVVLVSIVLHGITASSIMKVLGQWQEREQESTEVVGAE